MAQRRVRGAARPRRHAAPRRAARSSTRRSAASPRPTTSTPTRTRSTSAGPPVGALLQARLVARALPHADVHVPRGGAAPVARRRGRRLRPGVRGLAGLGPGAAGHRAGPSRRPRAPRCSTTGALLPASTAAEGEAAKPYAYDAGTRALQAHCDRIGFRRPSSSTTSSTAGSTTCARRCGTTRRSASSSRPPGTSARSGPSEITLVTHCVRSIVDRSTYPDYEIVVVADTSTPAAVLDELRATRRRPALARRLRPPVQLLRQDQRRAPSPATASTLLMLNDDMEVVTPDWLERLVMYSSFPGIGAVGAKLLFGDGRLQHVGVMMRRAQPGHLFRGFPGDHGGYANVVRVANNYSAVTGACLMTPRATVRRGRGPVASSSRSTSTTSTTASRWRPPGSGSCTTPTRCCSTSSRRADRRTCPTGSSISFQARWRAATMRRPVRQPQLPPEHRRRWCRRSTTPTAR